VTRNIFLGTDLIRPLNKSGGERSEQSGSHWKGITRIVSTAWSYLQGERYWI
jgi:hypothetical protein